MPRRRAVKRKAELTPVKTEEKDEFCFRDHLDTESISPHLFCSICQEVFVNPQRAPCGHSYCKICITMWLKQNKTCPDDRKPLQPSDMHHDFILENIIMDQKVACPHRQFGCANIGPLSNLSFHIKSCSFNPSIIPQFLKDEMRDHLIGSEIGESGKAEEESVYIPLKLRIFQAGGSQRENLMKVFNKPKDDLTPTERLRGLVDLLDDD